MNFPGWIFCLLLWSGVRAENFPRGQVLNKIACLQDAGQSYALYLPAAYQSGRSWPIVYCFDPRGRGGIPVALFKDAAEKYGYIVVGSNNAKNGPWESILSAMRAFWLDTHARLAIDDKRVYAAGFSGGARAACALGKMLSQTLAGVIACGAGLPEWLLPADLVPLPWFGIVGLHDFNFAEMQELARKFSVLGNPWRFEVFSGRHSWPPPDLCLQALEWLELQAKKTQNSLQQNNDRKVPGHGRRQ
jgi:dienelactone hydrolase